MALATYFQKQEHLLKSIAIIGAGLSGLTAARELSKTMNVQVFDKSRGVGGRMATRRAEHYEFDHGAQFFTAKSQDFQTFLSPFLKDGTVKEWNGKLVDLSIKGSQTRTAEHPCFVAVPGMSSLAKSLAKSVNIEYDKRIVKISGSPGQWMLDTEDASKFGPFDHVTTAVPAPQAIELLPQTVSFAQRLSAVEMQACFTLMCGFQSTLEVEFEGAFADDPVLGWIGINSSKPGRPGNTSVVVQSRNDWAQANTGMPLDDAAALLIKATKELSGLNLGLAEHKVIHRWLYASTANSAGHPFLYDRENSLSAIGDWCIRGRVEAAFESGLALSKELQECA